MGKVIELKQKEDPHMGGAAVCMNCRHTWAAVAPIGTEQLECPNCGTLKGFFANPVLYNSGTDHWRCSCGNWYFAMTREMIYCPNCGAVQTGF